MLPQLTAATLSLLCALPLLAADIQVSSAPITAVTVFADRAQVNRQLTLDLPAGEQRLIIDGLPASLWGDSLQVSGQARGQLQISHVELRLRPQAHSQHPRQQQLEQQLQSLQDEQQQLAGQRAAIDAQAAYIDSLSRNSQPQAATSNSLSPQQWPAAWQAIGEGMRSIGSARVSLLQQQRDLDNRLRLVQAELEQLQNQQQASYSALLQVSGQGGQATLNLRYQLPGAGWQPVYEASLDSRTSKLSLISTAQVFQATGEDWSNVALTLATSRPSAASQPPQLNPWWLDFAQPQPLAKSRAASPAPAMAEMAGSQDMLVMAEAVTTTNAELVSSPFAVEFRVAGRSSLSADNSRQRFVLGEQQWPVSLSLQAVPRLDPHAYLTASFSYDGKAPLLAGPWRLSRDGAYIGEQQQQLLRPGSTLQLAFGVDDAVTLEYLTLEDKRGESGLISKETEVIRRYRINASSGHQQPLPLTLSDQLPVAQNQQIKVALLKQSGQPQPEPVADQPGVLRWQLQLAAGKTTSVDFGYSVSYPGNAQLPGF